MRSRAISRTPGCADTAGSPPVGPREPRFEVITTPWGHHCFRMTPCTNVMKTQYSNHLNSFHYKITSTKHHVNPCCLFSHARLFSDLMDCSPPGSSVPGLFQGRTGVGCHFLLPGIFLIQGLNWSLLHLLQWQKDSLPLLHSGSPLDYCTVQLKTCTFYTVYSTGNSSQYSVMAYMGKESKN